MTLWSRRSFLAGSLALGTLAAGIAPAPAQIPAGFSSVAVDVGPLRAKGLGPFADLLAAQLATAARAAFADRLGGAGPRLVIRLTGLHLGAYVGGGGGGDRVGSGGGTTNDYLEGEALIVGPRGEVLARYPQLLALPASSGGAWYRPDNEVRRAAALADAFAGWLRRTVPG